MNFNEDINSYKALKSPHFVPCDFCDKEFNNMYESIKHNASHIIIPLWIQPLYNCNICNTYYTSVDDFETHNSSRHISTPRKYKNRKKIIEVIDITENDNKDEIKNIVDDLSIEVNEADDTDIVKLNGNEPIRSRIKFEEDEENGVLNDLITECHVDIQAHDPPWEFDKLKGQREYIKDMTAPDHTSIHYSNLMKPGIFHCKYCLKSYPNRFSLIKHEVCHITIRKGKPTLCIYCDRFIAGDKTNLNLHKEMYHPNVEAKRCGTHLCKDCGLRFRKYKRHVRNYHIYECGLCGTKFSNSKRHADHTRTCKTANVKISMIKVCELCFSFMKKRFNVRYYLIGETEYKLGVRYPCEGCGKEYFVLKIVKRIQAVRKHTKDHRSKLTNEDRLKNIQHRLKKLNLLNKFYFCCLFYVTSPLRCWTLIL